MRHTNIRKDAKTARVETPRFIPRALFLFLLIAFLPRHPASFAGSRSGEAATCESQAGGVSSGQTVTKEVPHSKESVSDLKERDAREPPLPRGDVAIPTHRILLEDNVTLPPESDGGPERKRTP